MCMVLHADVTDTAHCCGHHTVNVPGAVCMPWQAVLPFSLYVGQGSAGKQQKAQTVTLAQ